VIRVIARDHSDSQLRVRLAGESAVEDRGEDDLNRTGGGRTNSGTVPTRTASPRSIRIRISHQHRAVIVHTTVIVKRYHRAGLILQSSEEAPFGGEGFVSILVEDDMVILVDGELNALLAHR
jgi:hypothetical protein